METRRTTKFIYTAPYVKHHEVSLKKGVLTTSFHGTGAGSIESESEERFIDEED